MTEMNTKPRIHFETQQVIPLCSITMIVACAGIYVMAAGNGHTNSDLWVTNHCFSAPKAAALWNESLTLLVSGLKGTAGAFTLMSSHLSDLLNTVFLASFTCADRWQVVANCYFFWVYGASLEQRLGFARTGMIVLLAVILPWFVVGFEAASRDPSSVYYSPFFLLSTLVGATFLFPPEKKINANWFKSARGDIFAKQEEVDMMAKYQFKPMLFLTLFVIAQALIYFFNVGLFSYIPALHPGLKSVSLLGAAAAMLLGYVAASVMVWSATGSLRDGPMRLITVKMYHDIIKLDVGHDTAIKGTAHALGLPPERVKEWVGKQKGKMRVS
jgi:membrane associated rhomboid family serine protease